MVGNLIKKSLVNFLAASAFCLLAGFVLLKSGDSTVMAQTASTPGITIATVDLNGLVLLLDEHNAANDSMKQKIDDYQAQLASKKSDLQNLQAPLDPGNAMSLKAGTPEYEAQENKVLETSMALQTFDNFTQEELRLDHLQAEEDLYKHINDAVGEYAKNHGITLVLVTDDINYNVSQEQDLVTQIAARNVMYSDASLDI